MDANEEGAVRVVDAALLTVAEATAESLRLADLLNVTIARMERAEAKLSRVLAAYRALEVAAETQRSANHRNTLARSELALVVAEVDS